MISADVFAILKIISTFVCLGVGLYVLYGVQKTLNFTRRFREISDESKRIGTLAHEMTLKHIKGVEVGFDEYGYYTSKYAALVDQIHEYQNGLRWYNSDKFERTYYKHMLTMLEIDYNALTTFRELHGELKKLDKQFDTGYRNRVE